MKTSLKNRAIELIDIANSQDPNQELDAEGNSHPKELLYAQRMTRRLTEFAPSASEHLQIAARAQHIERWTSKRSDYPDGRTGYKQWRAELGLFHARRAAELMTEAGYTEDDVKRVQYLVQKRGLKRDKETQTLENVICLVFLEYYLAPFAQKHSEAKLIDIIQKTWAKMTEDGHNAALNIPLAENLKNIVGKALAG